MKANPVLALDRASAWARLGTINIGRLTATLGALPIVVPVNYLIEGPDSLVFAVEPDTALSRAIDGGVFAFVADGHDPRSERWWGVMVRGRALLAGASHAAADGFERLGLSPHFRTAVGAVELLHGGEVASVQDLPWLATHLTLPAAVKPAD